MTICLSVDGATMDRRRADDGATIDRHGANSDRHGASSNRNGANSDRHGANSDRHGANSDRRRVASGPQGLSTADALQKLKSGLRDVLDELRKGGDGWNRRRLWRETSECDGKSVGVGDGGGGGGGDEKDAEDEIGATIVGKSPLRISTAIPFDYWSVALLAISIVVLLVSQAMAPTVSASIFVEVIILLGFSGLNVWLCRREERLKNEELFVRLESVIKDIVSCEEKADLGEESALPSIHIPTSPSISLQWTYRDGVLVNLPTALLVKGDVVVLRPGAVAPSLCRASKVNASDKHRDSPETLGRGERFLPAAPCASPGSAAPLPQIRPPLPSRTCVLLETPVLRNVRDAATRLTQRQPSLVNLVQSHVRLKVVERYLIVALVLFHCCASLVFHLMYEEKDDDDGDDVGTNSLSTTGSPTSIPWALLIARHLVFCLIPVLPLARVGWTFLVQCYASACIVNTLKTFGERKIGQQDHQRGKDNVIDDSSDADVKRRFLSGSGKLLELESLSIQEEPASSIVKDFSQELLRLPQAQMRNKGFLEAFYGRIRGPSGFIDRLVDLTHNLATITSICCIDKYGILSFPDPTPEKVFFITSQEGEEEKSESEKEKGGSRASVVSLFGDGSSENVNAPNTAHQDPAKKTTSGDANAEGDPNRDCDVDVVDDADENESGIFSKENRIEVLNISHKEERCGYRLQFDDPRWRKYASNLKPLGLHILVNICNKEVIPKYSEFSAHLNCVTHRHSEEYGGSGGGGSDNIIVGKSEPKDPTSALAAAPSPPPRPLQVLERRCMCDLSSMIGFASSAKDVFALQHQAYTYRKVKLEATKDRTSNAGGNRNNAGRSVAPLRTRHFVRQKVTVPSMSAVLMRERDSGMIQLMSQGTADVVLDSCSDVWDGFDLVPLDDAYRKKIMDFFQRNNLASHCAALSYCPLGCASKLGPFYDDLYVELPADTKDILDVLLSPSLLRKMGAAPFGGEEVWRRGLPVSPFVARLASESKSNERYLSEESLCRTKDVVESSAAATANATANAASTITTVTTNTTTVTAATGEKLSSKLSNVHVKLLQQMSLDRSAAAAASVAFAPSKQQTTSSTTTTTSANLSPPPFAVPSESNSLQSISDCIRQQFEQIFVGMVTMQYQAKLDVIHLIEELEKACIRFVHFSKENELRSRVFTEKMGLEAGWNCHISLEDSPSDEDADGGGGGAHPSMSASRQSSAKRSNAGDGSNVGDALLGRLSVSPGSGIPRRSSCPSAIHADSSQVRFVDDDFIINPSVDGADPSVDPSINGPGVTSEAALLTSATGADAPAETAKFDLGINDGDDNDDEGIEDKSLDEEGKTERTEVPTADSDLIELSRRFATNRSADTLADDDDDDDDDGDTDANSAVTGNSSHPTTSGMTSSTDRFPIDFSNRAKLPRGVVNVRPHLEKVDNVPLLVSLFTDCTPETSTEMMEIMREYGECVCCIGSCANFANYRQFSTADIALAVEPMYPRLCSNEGGPESNCTSKLVQSDDTVILSKTVSFETASPGSLIWLSNKINAFPCASLFRRNDDVVICALIALARHLVLVSSSAAEFQLYGQLTLTLTHFLPLLLMAASPLNVPQILWVSLVILPLLSLSILGSPIDPYVMTLSPPKKELFTSAYFARHVGVYLCKFGLTILYVLAVFYFTLYNMCVDAGKSAAVETPEVTTNSSLPIPPPISTAPISNDSGPGYENRTQNIACSSLYDENGTHIIACSSLYEENRTHTIACSPLYHFARSDSTSGVRSLVQGASEDVPFSIVLAQCVVSFFLVFYLIVSSSNFVHRYHSSWKRNPFNNFIWGFTTAALLFLHLIFCLVQAAVSSSSSSSTSSLSSYRDTERSTLSDIPWEAWLLLCLWPPVLVGILEALKHSEIKRFVRQQKLQRLNFDTKLGMNSPF